MIYAALSLLTACALSAAPSLSPSIEADAEYLLTTTDFMDAQYGMSVESATETNGQIVVVTTGAQFVFAPDESLLTIRQRIGANRELAQLTFTPGALADLRITRQGTGAVVLETPGGALRMRINGDSLLMIKPRAQTGVACRTEFEPAWIRGYQNSRLLLDEYGGIGMFAAAGDVSETVAMPGTQPTYAVAPEGVLWIAPAPPKPYDWGASFRDRVVWHWSTTTGYPTDAQIAEWSKYGNILLQQAEVMLWKDWGLRFVPRFGIKEFRRVNDTCAKYGMRNIVYTSPYYFIAGTSVEHLAVNNFDNGVHFHPGEGSGANWPIFLDQIQKVMREYKPDGLYFDGIYKNVVREYLISRKSRETVGEDGILEFHATGRAPGGGVFLPQSHAYYNFILSGEGNQSAYTDPDYLRFFVSTYNISNSIGVLCNNNNYELTPEFLGTLLDNNIRLHLIPGWISDYRLGALQKYYWPALEPGLEARVAAAGEKRHARHCQYIRELTDALKAGVTGLQTAFQDEFTERVQWANGGVVSGWTAHLSPVSKAAARTADGVLRLEATANTYAFVERPAPDNVAAVECELRGTGNFGQSWGPGLVLYLGHQCLRVGVRTDDQAQVDRLGAQLLYDDFPAGKWYRLRVRLALGHAIFEAAPEDGDWRMLEIVRVPQPDGPRRVAVGKVPFDGQPKDYQDAGPAGGCEVRYVKMLAAAK